MKFPWQKSQKPRETVGRRGRYSDEFREATTKTEFRMNTTLNTFHHDEAAELAREKTRKLRDRRRRLGVLLLVLAAILAIGLLVLSQFNGAITKVTGNASSMSADESDRYKNLVGDYFAQNPFERFSFGRRNDALTEFVIAQAPEVKTLKITSAGLMRGQMQLTFREPVAMWTSGQTINYVDAEGVVFSRNYFAEPSVKIADNSGVSPVDGVAASPRFLSFVGKTTAEIAKIGGGAVDRVVIPSGAIRYVEFYLAGRAYPFKAQIDRDPASQAADIVAMAKYLDAHQIIPNYVDVRVASKGFWR